MDSLPRITFGIIVLNGEPFTRYNLRALYPFAHEIIVAEGAAPGAASTAAPNGHSTDGTLDVLRDFKAREDPKNKLTVVTAEDQGYSNGFWPGEKDEQSQAYAKRATGDYLWQVDIDEFYKPEDIMTITKMLNSDKNITQIDMPQIGFWGGFDYTVNGLFIKRFYSSLGGGQPRLFKWGPRYRYVAHRPATVVDSNDNDLRTGKWIKGDKLAKKGVFCYHYSSIFPNSVTNRVKYYSNMNWRGHEQLAEWYESNFVRIQRPFHIHHVYSEISWLTRFRGTHPPQIQQLISDINNGSCYEHLRNTNDLEKLLSKKWYSLTTYFLAKLAPPLVSMGKLLPPLERLTARFIDTILGIETLFWH